MPKTNLLEPAKRAKSCCDGYPDGTILLTIRKSGVERNSQSSLRMRKALDDSLFPLSLLPSCLRMAASGFSQEKPFRVLAFYSTHVEQDHVDFAMQAIPFFQSMAKRDRFEFRATSNWDEMNPAVLKDCQVVLWLDEFPSTPAAAQSF